MRKITYNSGTRRWKVVQFDTRSEVIIFRYDEELGMYIELQWFKNTYDLDGVVDDLGRCLAEAGNEYKVLQSESTRTWILERT
jgi:hypothetical protein